jgi:hypothetical protein
MRITEILTESSAVTLKKLYHVGSLNVENKRDHSYEGAGLSVSTHPDAWRKIARGHVTGDTYQAVKPNNKFLNANRLSKNDKKEITDRITSFYKKGRSKPTYKGIIRENDIDINNYT